MEQWYLEQWREIIELLGIEPRWIAIVILAIAVLAVCAKKLTYEITEIKDKNGKKKYLISKLIDL